jgi:hypothetical protein
MRPRSSPGWDELDRAVVTLARPRSDFRPRAFSPLGIRPRFAAEHESSGWTPRAGAAPTTTPVAVVRNSLAEDRVTELLAHRRTVRHQAIEAAVCGADDHCDHLAIGGAQQRAGLMKLAIVSEPGAQALRPKRVHAKDVRHEADSLSRAGEQAAQIRRQWLRRSDGSSSSSGTGNHDPVPSAASVLLASSDMQHLELSCVAQPGGLPVLPGRRAARPLAARFRPLTAASSDSR